MSNGMARWRFNQVSYINDRLYAEGEIAEFPVTMNKPGPHWEPLDDAARNIMKAAGQEYTGEVPDVLSKLLPAYEDATSRAIAEGKAIDTTAIAEAFKQALASVFNPQAAIDAVRDTDAFKAAVKQEVADQIAAARAAKKGGKADE